MTLKDSKTISLISFLKEFDYVVSFSIPNIQDTFIFRRLVENIIYKKRFDFSDYNSSFFKAVKKDNMKDNLLHIDSDFYALEDEVKSFLISIRKSLESYKEKFIGCKKSYRYIFSAKHRTDNKNYISVIDTILADFSIEDYLIDFNNHKDNILNKKFEVNLSFLNHNDIKYFHSIHLIGFTTFEDLFSNNPVTLLDDKKWKKTHSELNFNKNLFSVSTFTKNKKIIDFFYSLLIEVVDEKKENKEILNISIHSVDQKIKQKYSNVLFFSNEKEFQDYYLNAKKIINSFLIF